MKNAYEIRGDKVAIFIDRKDGSVLETIIDINDLEKVKAISGKWYAKNEKNSQNIYVRFNTVSEEGTKTTIDMQRWLTDLPGGLLVDHIDHNTLNNTRKNLRVVTKMVNSQNLKTCKRNISGYRGVFWNKKLHKWAVTIFPNGKRVYLGLFTDVKLAAEVAHRAMVKLMPGYIPDERMMRNSRDLNYVVGFDDVIGNATKLSIRNAECRTYTRRGSYAEYFREFEQGKRAKD